MNIEKIILEQLIHNEEYIRKVLPFLNKDYFSAQEDKIVFDLIDSYFQKYNKPPILEALAIDLVNRTDLNENTFKESKSLLLQLRERGDYQLEWLMDNTETFCKDRAIHNAILNSISIIENKSGTRAKGEIPQLLSDALAVSFDTSVGHDYLSDWESRYEEYQKVEDVIPFDLEFFNKITDGGLPKKTLTVILAGTGGGKSRLMCHMAAANLRDNRNVLYITLEMAAIKGIAQRIDANLLNVPINELKTMPKQDFSRRMKGLSDTCKGKLIIKEYPTATAGTLHFKHLLNELKIKNNFIPDIVYVDYINLCLSSRIKHGSGGSYEYVKAVAEELRGLAGEYDFPLVTATQVNRNGFSSSDIELTDTAESFGLPATSDLFFALIATEELDEIDQVLVKQLKNRFNNPAINRKFVIGIDKPKFRHYDVEPEAQEDILDGPIMDQTNIGMREKDTRKDFDEFY